MEKASYKDRDDNRVLQLAIKVNNIAACGYPVAKKRILGFDLQGL